MSETGKARCPYCKHEQDVDTSKYENGTDVTVCGKEDGGCDKWYVYTWQSTVSTNAYKIESLNEDTPF